MTGLRGALTVRVSDGTTDRIVTRYCRGLKFTKTAPGGHHSMTFTMTLPRNTFEDLGPQDRAYLYDARTARPVFDAYLENPTPVDGPDGQEYDILAMGGKTLASDETRGLVYVDQGYDGWALEAGSSSSGNVQTGTLDTVPNVGVETQFPQGLTVGTSVFIAAGYRRIATAGMSLGAVRVVSYSGKTDTGYRLDLFTDDGGGTVNAVGSGSQIQTTAVDQTFYVGTHFGTVGTPTRAVLQLRRSGGATTIGDDITFGRFVGLFVLGQRMNRNGTLLTGSGGLVTAQQVLASQVVEDLLGRLLTFCDPDTAQVDTTAFGITQFAYPDGVKAAGVLNDLAVFEPGYLWEILESNDSGKHRFNFRAWPTAPRYEVSVKDGWRQSGSDVDLCNRIFVTWSDSANDPQQVAVTAASLGLTGIGLPVDALGSRVKDADPISLPAGRGSSDNAYRIGAQVLTDKINPPKAGTVAVRRPIVDQLTGNIVMPWELEPGYVCRIRETGDDLRITQVDYDDDSCSAVLTLGTPALTTDQRVARLDRVAA